MMETINNILFWTGLFLLSWNIYFLLFNNGVPNIPTAQRIRRMVAAHIKKDWESRSASGKSIHPVIYDLGSGNGGFLRDIAKLLPHADVRGVEISAVAYFMSVILTQWMGYKNISITSGDFLQENLYDADYIVLFMNAYTIDAVSQKLMGNTKPGAVIYSNRFALRGDWPLSETLKTKTLHPKQGIVHVYKKPSADCQ